MRVAITPQSALVVVDVQNDFCPGGALAVPGGDKVIPPLNRLAERFAGEGRPVYYTRDWHPPDHVSFEAQGGPWPVHCVADTEGAAFHPALERPDGAHEVVHKATTPREEAYSGFMNTDLAKRLRDQGVERVFVGGLATDYCVKNTVLDALDEGFDVVLLTDAVRGVDVAPGDSEEAIEEMLARGAVAAETGEVE